MDNDFTDFLTNNWNEKFKAANSPNAQLEQIQQQQSSQHHQQHQQQQQPQQELQKITSFSPTSNRMFMDELANIRNHQQQQIRNNVDLKLSFSPSQHYVNHQQTSTPTTSTTRPSTLNNSNRSVTQQQQQQQLVDIKQELRLSNLVSPTSTLRLPEDTTICRSTMINNMRGNNVGGHNVGGHTNQSTSTSTSTFNGICSSLNSVGQDIADSTTPPPSIQSSSSNSLGTSSMSVIGDGEKKTANSIRGNIKN